MSGVIDKATLGHPGKYTWCIAEAEEVSPWEPLHVERGFSKDDSAVTVFAGLSQIQASYHESGRPEEILGSFTDALLASGHEQQEVVLVLCPEHVGYIRSHGWSKDDVRSFLFESTRRKAAEWTGPGAVPREAPDPESAYGVGSSPESFTLIVGGGAAGAFSAIIPLWGWRLQLPVRYETHPILSPDRIDERAQNGGLDMATATRIEVLDPTVEAIPASAVISPRPDTLDGAVVGLLSNGKRNADALLEMVHEVLADRFEFGEVLERDKGNASRPCPTDMMEELAEQCDLVITASGD